MSPTDLRDTLVGLVLLGVLAAYLYLVIKSLF